MSEEEPDPEENEQVYMMCQYCRNLFQGLPAKMSFPRMGCGKIKDEGGRYAIISPKYGEVVRFREEGKDSVWGVAGCGKFESSGLPAHPAVVGELREKNNKVDEIPIDSEATETKWQFLDKVHRYSENDRVSNDNFQ